MSQSDLTVDARTLPPFPDTRPHKSPSRRIVIISASVGAGHDGAADELARRLERDGFLVDRHDFLDLLPARLGAMLSGTYHRLLTWAPTGYQRIYAATEHTTRPGLAVRALLRSAERRTLRAIPPDSRAVVSTYPGASQVLGSLRLSGRLSVPAITYLTDFSVHSLWVAPGIDTHLAAHPIPAGQARARGAAGVTVTGPVAAARFTPATSRARSAARARFALPEHGALALLVAGSWGVGPVEQVAAELQESGAAVPVVVCGRNQTLAERLRTAGVQHVYGWVEDMPALMAAADVLVQNAGGLTSLEAFASGLPVASYRCIPGHGQTNAAALHEAGLAVWIRHRADLAPALTGLLHGPLGRRQRDRGLALFRQGDGPAQAVAATAGRRTSASDVIRPTTLRSSASDVIRPATLRSSAAVASRRSVRRRITVTAVAAAVTVLLGIGAPLAEAYSEAPHGLAAVTHFLDADQR
jgi:UDP-N-acetylglucosamine:LPS N-acetylglucosamine transferase